jgi:multimeric flavodoxin WrbA
MGSPRKGESYKITQLVEERMKGLGEVEFEYLFLMNSGLKQCVGCHACINLGEDACPHKSERKVIEEKMSKADGIIIVSPVYCQNVTGLLKNFFDHIAFMWHRPRYFHKKVMAISSGGGQFKETLKHMEQNAKAWGCDFVCSLGVPHLDALTPKYKEKALKDINKKASLFFNKVKEKRIVNPGLGRLIWFNIWKGNSIACKDTIPQDLKYWDSMGWLDKEYFYTAKINVFKKAVIALVGKIGKIMMHRIYIGY